MPEIILPGSIPTGKIWKCWCGSEHSTLAGFEQHAAKCFRRNRDFLQDVAERIKEDPFIGQGNEETQEAQTFIWRREHGELERPTFGKRRRK
jgi:hypothetical protein